MGLHHIAIATRDIQATHEFYTRAMGFELVKVVVAKLPGGWAKHVFYATGPDGLIAFWDLHDERLPADWSADISGGLGLPTGINHFAFAAADRGELDAHRDRWLRCGHDVLEIDHGFCTSIYTTDPNGIMVEFCMDNRPLDARDREQARQLLADPHPPLSDEAGGQRLYRAADFAAAGQALASR